MEMANDLLRREQGVVADVVDRNLDADRSPLCSVKSQLAGCSPGLGFDSFGWFAKQSLLGWIKHPRLIAIEGDR